MLKKIAILSFIIISLLIFTIAVFTDYVIHKALLKYNRESAVKFAKENWYRTADGFVNYGPSHLEALTNEKIKELNINIESDIYKECRDSLKIAGKCPGDCANFVSQCLITGSIPFRDLIKGLKNLSMIQKDGISTAANAGELEKRLLQMGAYCNKNKIMKDSNGVVVPLGIEDLEPGDIIFGRGPGMSARHPYVVGSKPVFISSGEEYFNYTGFYSHSFSLDITDTTTLIEPLTLFHFPNVTMIKEIEVYSKAADGTMKVYYRAWFDETKNKGDGKIVRDISFPIEIERVSGKNNGSLSNLIFKFLFTNPVNRDNNSNKIMMIPAKKKNQSGNESKLNKEIEFSPLSYSEDKKTIIYTLSKDQIASISAGIYILEIQVYSQDNTPINGNGTFEKYKEAPDRNHKITFFKQS